MRFALAAPLSLVLMVACAESDSTDPVLSRVDPEPAGTNCPAGGSAVRTGLDNNRNGTLEEGEVSGVQFVCADAAMLVLRQDIESPGTNCANGGTALRAGLDMDGDGVLDDAEVLRTTFACGTPPATAPATLTRTFEQLPGTTCPAGGTRVEAGLDLDSDGALDDTEVRTSSVVCGAGPVRIRTRSTPLAECGGTGTLVESGFDSDLDGALDDSEVTATSQVCRGTAWLQYPVATAEDVDILRRATRIAGSLVIQGSLLESIYLSLDVVDGDVDVLDNPGLKSFHLTVGLLGGGIHVARNPVLESVTIAPRFTSGYGGLRVPRDVIVENNPKLRAPLDAGDLGSVDGSLIIRDNDVLQLSQTLEQLRFVGRNVLLARNAAMSSVCMSRVDWVLGSFTIEGNAALEKTTLGFACGLGVKHVGGPLVVKDNPVLNQAMLPMLETVGGVELSNNVRFPVVSMPEVRVVGGDVVVSGSGGWPTFSSYPRVVIDGSVIVRDTPYAGFSLPYVDRINGDLRVAANPSMTVFMLNDLVEVAGGVSILENPALTRIAGPESLPALSALRRAGSLTVSRNASLATLKLPSLETVGGLTITENPALPTCEAEAVAAQLSGSPSVTIAGNDDAATCQ